MKAKISITISILFGSLFGYFAPHLEPPEKYNPGLVDINPPKEVNDGKLYYR